MQAKSRQKHRYLRGRRTSTAGTVSYPNENSNWDAGSEYEITWNWEGIKSDEYVQVYLFQNDKLYASLVSSTINDGHVSITLDSGVPSSDSSTIQIALLPDKEDMLISDYFSIVELEVSDVALNTTAGVIMLIIVVIGGIFVIVNARKFYKEWKETREKNLKLGIKQQGSVFLASLSSPFKQTKRILVARGSPLKSQSRPKFPKVVPIHETPENGSRGTASPMDGSGSMIQPDSVIFSQTKELAKPCDEELKEEMGPNKESLSIMSAETSAANDFS